MKRTLIVVFTWLSFIMVHANWTVPCLRGEGINGYVEISNEISLPYPVDLLPDNETVNELHFRVATDTNLPMTEFSTRSDDQAETPVIISIATTEYGQLQSLLEENDAETATEIILSGPMDQSDFDSLWELAVKGNLRVLDLKDARIKDKNIPDYALYRPAQFEAGHLLGIRKIILPDDVVRIGKAAFPFMRLEEVNIPSSLKELGSSAFAYDYWLNCPIRLPEGVEEIRHQTFIYCQSLQSAPILPSSLRKIAQHVFALNPFTSIELNDGLEFIGEGAFQASGLREVRIPASVTEMERMAFQACNGITNISLPETMTTIPFGLFSYCNGLESVVLPPNVKRIENSAFMWCTELKDVVFPDALEVVEQDAFDGCLMEKIVLPANIKELGSSCFSILGLRAVYCAAPTPPYCESEPFAPFVEQWISDTPLYVPTGTKQLYQTSWQWNLFKEIIETDRFPSAVAPVGIPYDQTEGSLFDLSGKKVTNPLPHHIYVRNGKKIYIH